MVLYILYSTVQYCTVLYILYILYMLYILYGTCACVKSSPTGAPATPRVFPQRALVQSFKTKSSPLSRLVVATCWWPSVLQPGASGTIYFLLSGLVFLCRFSILQQRAQPLRDFMCSLSQRAQCFVSDQ